MKEVNFAVEFLKNPERTLNSLNKEELDPLLSKYLKLLIASSLLAGLFTFSLGVIRAAYYDIFLNAQVDYFGVLNYSGGRAISIFFLYLFVGTFGNFLLIAFISKFLNRKFVRTTKLAIFATLPVLVFGWITPLALPLLVWCGFILYSGLR